MSVKYNSVDRVRSHGTGFAIVSGLRNAAAWMTFASKAGDAIAGFMLNAMAGFKLIEVAAPVWAPVRIRTFASQGR
jgi:hypothetical protein